MKKKNIFSIVLCACLLAPELSLATEQSWREWITKGLVNAAQSAYTYTTPSLHRLTSWATDLISNIDQEKWVWYGTLATMAIGGYTALSYRKMRLQAEIERQQKEQEEIAFKEYGMLPISTSRTITSDDYFNIGTFLYNASSDTREKSQHRFDYYVLPILKKSIPVKPQTLINYEKFGNQDPQNRFMPEDIKNNPDVQRYYDNTEVFWHGLVQMANIKLQQRELSKRLRINDFESLKIIQSYLQDNDPIKQSITDALGQSN